MISGSPPLLLPRKARLFRAGSSLVLGCAKGRSSGVWRESRTLWVVRRAVQLVGGPSFGRKEDGRYDSEIGDCWSIMDSPRAVRPCRRLAGSPVPMDHSSFADRGPFFGSTTGSMNGQRSDGSFSGTPAFGRRGARERYRLHPAAQIVSCYRPVDVKLREPLGD
jgi:hypothetical protein